ncbi:hypothetical protein SASPL_149527 [Salvia splendens]|uniref:DYW domain-containing protein n=1 Tax=Salvia splendens TaxID=180675 RepID=A0A8X8Z4G2_SALSN|nr:hypothetical protein SASPL_149527 [Salvia splendens]
MWRTLLGACRIHGYADLGERVIEHLVELKAQEAGDYVLLLNIYSSCGDSDKVMEVRKAMKDKGIHTTPASSTIELKGKAHEFFADDVLHPRKREIYEMLGEIIQQLRIGGYVAEISSEMQRAESGSEAYVLSYHSEKLAAAFGILSTPPGLRIALVFIILETGFALATTIVKRTWVEEGRSALSCRDKAGRFSGGY